MNILAIDTSGPVAGCALMVDDRIVWNLQMDVGLTHSESIMPAVDRALTAAGLVPADIDCFAAVAGPGSFTGVRIGVCAVKGLAHAANRPCARVHALEALAMNYYGYDGLACPILDARRGQVYCAAYDMVGGFPREVVSPGARPLADFLAMLPPERALGFAGDGVRAYQEIIRAGCPGRSMLTPPTLAQLRSDAACWLALNRREDWMPAAQLTPIYLRAPQAERERAAGRDHTKSLRRQRAEEAAG